MLTLLLVVCSLVIGFAWGVALTIHYRVLPIRKELSEQRKDFVVFLDEQIETLKAIKYGRPVVSPIQIKRD